MARSRCSFVPGDVADDLNLVKDDHAFADEFVQSWEEGTDDVFGVDDDDGHGGPVFAGVNNYAADEARGMITALDRTVTCPSSEYVLDSGVRTPWCVQGVYFVPIFQTLYDMNWTLVTQ